MNPNERKIIEQLHKLPNETEVSEGLEQRVLSTIKDGKSNRKNQRLFPYLAITACLVILIPLAYTTFLHLSHHQSSQSKNKQNVNHKIHKVTYATFSKAKVAAMPSLNKINESSHTINLSGFRLKVEKLADSSKYQWKQRKWLVIYKGFASSQKELERTKKLVTYLDKPTALPRTSHGGTVTIVNTQKPIVNPRISVVWRSGKTVYSLKQNDETINQIQSILTTNMHANDNPSVNMTAKQLGDYFKMNGENLPFGGTNMNRILPGQQRNLNLKSGLVIQPTKQKFGANGYRIIDEWKGDLKNKPFILDIYQQRISNQAIVGLTYNHQIKVAYSAGTNNCIVRNFTGSFVTFAAPNTTGKFFSINLITGQVIPPNQVKLNEELAGTYPGKGHTSLNNILGLNKKYPFTPQDKKASPVYKSSLNIPNGRVIKTDQNVRWKDMDVQLLVFRYFPSLVSKNGYQPIIGKHSTIIGQRRVSTSVGQATLIHIKRSLPGTKKNKVKNEYWVIKIDKQIGYGYAIEGTVVGNKLQAKNEFMQLLKQWKVMNQ